MTLLLLLVAVPSLVAAYLHTRALLEHMRGASTKVSCRSSSAMTHGRPGDAHRTCRARKM